MSLAIAQEYLGWPSRADILEPPGIGPRVFAELAREKLGRAISLYSGIEGIAVGVLAIDPAADATEAPLAVVCEFPTAVGHEILEETHRLAWNFSRSPLLVTVEPHLIRAWSCCEPPSQLPLDPFQPQVEIFGTDTTAPNFSHQAAISLHWVELATGEFFRRHHSRFRRDQAADSLLLSNLIYVREELRKLGLPYEVSHDLLARMIFIQFLFHRKDTSGTPALNARMLARLHAEGLLSMPHASLSEVLRYYDDAYALFRWLNDRFNGDLFPGKGATIAEREAEWQAEMNQVQPRHLTLLADFVSGQVEMRPGQLCLWPQYSFDAIPLEFISSIYEVFVSKQSASSAHYTPGHLVDFVLDGVLPWNSQDWDLRILDPACGSGIFLVKSFQRLIHRWRLANPSRDPGAEDLRRILERNLVGIDIDPDAVRVASFSLYLAMCDEIDPRHYWNRVHFPRLRGVRLVHGDFFSESVPGINSQADAGTYDLVIGNAPWGTGSATSEAVTWAKLNGWHTAYKDVGPLFLPKALKLIGSGGLVSMLQPAGAILFNRVSTARTFRRKLFSEFDVAEVVNLSALRFGLFEKAISPACIITLRAGPPADKSLTYIAPKSVQTREDDYRVVIDLSDIHEIPRYEAAENPLIWTVFAWGGERDWSLIRRLVQMPNLRRLQTSGKASVREGVKRGDRKRVAHIANRKFLTEPKFPSDTFLALNAACLPLNTDMEVHSRDSTNYEAFELPQLIIKQAWRKNHGRFEAAVVDPSVGKGILCSESYVSVHVPAHRDRVLNAACLALNSKIGTYFLLLTSGRFASYRPEPNLEDLLSVPIFPLHSQRLAEFDSLDTVDYAVRDGLGLQDAEWALVEDLFEFTLPDFKGDLNSPGRKRTRRTNDEIHEPDLNRYCGQYTRVIKSGFGADKRIAATIFHDTDSPLPVRIVAFYFDAPRDGIHIEQISSDALYNRLRLLNERLLTDAEASGIFYQRVARIFDTIQWEGRSVPTVYYVKPDQIRYWTRSAALRDADEVAAELVSWGRMLDSTLPEGGESE